MIIKSAVALAAFCVGVVVASVNFYGVVMLSPLVIFIGFPLSIIGIVAHQLIVRKHNRGQVVGKGLVAIIMWSLPSMLAIVSIVYSLLFYMDVVEENKSPLMLGMMVATDMVCVVAGWWLCGWVKNPNNEELGMWERSR
jgi:hypothetical protein